VKILTLIYFYVTKHTENRLLLK